MGTYQDGKTNNYCNSAEWNFLLSQMIGKYRVSERVKGFILNMVASDAWNAGVGIVHSSAAKAGVLSSIRTLAVEWEREM